MITLRHIRSGVPQGDYQLTGQKLDATGLMYYGARYYDHVVGREPSGWRHRQVGAFISPDTLVPDPTNLWDYNLFAYARLNPLKYSDPSGHCNVMHPMGFEPDGKLVDCVGGGGGGGQPGRWPAPACQCVWCGATMCVLPCLQ
jgi:hypothetical protein